VQLATALSTRCAARRTASSAPGPEEYAAGAFLSRFADQQLLESILRVQRPRGTMDVIRLALTDRQVAGGFSIAGVGYVRHADRDAIPQATDFLQTEENVHTAIVYGILMGEGDREVIVGQRAHQQGDAGRRPVPQERAGQRRARPLLRRRPQPGRSRADGFEIPRLGFLEGRTADGRAEQMRTLEVGWRSISRSARAPGWRLLRPRRRGAQRPERCAAGGAEAEQHSARGAAARPGAGSLRRRSARSAGRSRAGSVPRRAGADEPDQTDDFVELRGTAGTLRGLVAHDLRLDDAGQAESPRHADAQVFVLEDLARMVVRPDASRSASGNAAVTLPSKRGSAHWQLLRHEISFHYCAGGLLRWRDKMDVRAAPARGPAGVFAGTEQALDGRRRGHPTHRAATVRRTAPRPYDGPRRRRRQRPVNGVRYRPASCMPEAVEHPHVPGQARPNGGATLRILPHYRRRGDGQPGA
jgi:hypothetical protein